MNLANAIHRLRSSIPLVERAKRFNPRPLLISPVWGGIDKYRWMRVEKEDL
jgi:hypothetical protein